MNEKKVRTRRDKREIKEEKEAGMTDGRRKEERRKIMNKE